MKLSSYAKYAWGVLGYILLVILWGAYVRATGSGAGCGSHWPLCNGEVIPRAPQIETMIEFTHRAMSGLALLLVVGMLVWALRAYPKGHLIRFGAWLSMAFIITEALVGAGLVLFEWVAEDASIGRAISMAVHLVNTFFLLAALTLNAWWSSGGKGLQLRNRGTEFWGLAAAVVGMLILGVSGALNALGDTLFPVSSLAEGIQQDFSPTAHFLIRLRLLHPSIAIVVGIYLIFLMSFLNLRGSTGRTKQLSRALILLVVIQIAAGFLNVALLAPVWMQIVHLFLADAVWITLVLLTATALRSEESEVHRIAPLPKHVSLEANSSSK